jgi:peptide/nickel transport system permease protein
MTDVVLRPPEKLTVSKAAGRRKIVVGFSVLAVIAALGLLAPILTPYEPTKQDLLNKLQGWSGDHWLGTDHLGRDLLTRLLYAARVDLPLGLAGAAIPAVVGTILGAVAGFFGRWIDAILMWLANFAQSFPIYIFVVALVFALGPGPVSFLVALTAVAWVTYARLIRSEILRLRDQEFVHAVRVAGFSRRRILFRHVLPNAIPQTVVYFASDIVLALITLTALSFFGLGIQPPTPEWGQMIAEGRLFIRTQWWISVVPGVAIMAVGIAASLISDGLDDRMRS